MTSLATFPTILKIPTGFQAITNITIHAEQFNQLHTESLTFLKQALNQNYTTKKVVVTHHVPTFLNYPEKYRGDALNEAFAVELYNFIEDSVADYWIYGHTHCNTADFKIGSTQLLTNQLGYVKYGEQKLFDTKKFINVPMSIGL